MGWQVLKKMQGRVMSTDLQKRLDQTTYRSLSRKTEASGAIFLGLLLRLSLLYAVGKITFKKYTFFSIKRNNMSFMGSIQMIFFSMLKCTIGSKGGPNKMTASNFLWLHFLNNMYRSPIHSLFCDQWFSRMK